MASWPSVKILSSLLLALGLLMMPARAVAADRVALVLGNSTYAEATPLDNPVNDATDVSETLERLGFEVTLRLNASEDAMDKALLAFGEQSSGAEMALVFYAGHGLEMNGVNYLVPVDAQLKSAAAVPLETVALDSVMTATEGARTRIVIVDACRNNPFVRSMRGATRSNVRAGGLAVVRTGEGLLVAYAAAAGATAADGTGQRNSPYTAALLAHLERSNTELRVMFGDVGAEVVASTGADQQPFIYTSLSGEHYLNSPAEPAAVAVVARDGALAAEVQQETVFWQSVADSGTPADFEAYLDQFPGGTYSALARNRMETLLAASNASPLARAAAETAELQETVFWQSVADSGNPADFEAYLGQFPDGTYSVLARNRMETLLAASNASPLARAAAETAELQETVFWQSVADSGNPADFEAYLGQFPDGTYSVLARIRMDTLLAAAAAPPPVLEGAAPVPESVLLSAPVAGGSDMETLLAAAAAPPPALEGVAYVPESMLLSAPVAEVSDALLLAIRPAEEVEDVVAPVPAELDPPEPVSDLTVLEDPPFFEPGLAFRNCSDCPELVVVPAGPFRMGSTTGQADERPVHEVSVGQFALGRYEVTLEEYEAFVMATDHVGDGCSVVGGDSRMDWEAGASWHDPEFSQHSRHPVACVSWDDAQAYVQWLSARTGKQYRLPSEAEWEYGARANTVTERYWAAESGSQCDYANGGDRALMQRFGGWPLPVVNCSDGVGHTAEVGFYKPNAFGLLDMLGNVWEWTADCWHESYRGAPDDGSPWTRGGDCDRRVLRGGSWDTPASGIRSSNRYGNDNRATSLSGFRVARDLR